MQEKDKILETIREIMDESFVECDRIDKEIKKSNELFNNILGKVKKIKRGRFIGLTKKENEQMSEANYKVLDFEQEKEKIKIAAYERIKELVSFD